MKKNYLFTLLLTIFLSGISFGQDLLITGIIDGPLPGGAPKALELYAVAQILLRFNNQKIITDKEIVSID